MKTPTSRALVNTLAQRKRAQQSLQAAATAHAAAQDALEAAPHDPTLTRAEAAAAALYQACLRAYLDLAT